jgi:hypothetical protein
VRVFISSVRYVLKDERSALPPFLRILGHEGLRFEDFTAQDVSSREACLAGVDAADVYVLLLGPRYGDPFPDTGLSPTAEEFQAARNRQIPILVFAKNTDEPDEPAQAAFKEQVGHWVNGRLWRFFDDPMSLTIAVGEALNALRAPGGPLRLTPLVQPPAAPWLEEQSHLRPREVDAPLLELHLLRVTPALIGASVLASVADGLARDVRLAGFIANSDPLETGSTNGRAWAARPPSTTHHRSNSATGWTEEAWRGVALAADGTASAWTALPYDMFGTRVDRPFLQKNLAQLVALTAAHVGDADEVAIGVRLSPAGKITEGDPSAIGKESSGGWGRDGVSIVIEPSFSVSQHQLTSSAGDLAAELATRVLNDVREIRPY